MTAEEAKSIKETKFIHAKQTGKNHLKLLEMVSHRQVILQVVKAEGIHAIEEVYN
jgi:hypothetical protein